MFQKSTLLLRKVLLGNVRTGELYRNRPTGKLSLKNNSPITLCDKREIPNSVRVKKIKLPLPLFRISTGIIQEFIQLRILEFHVLSLSSP